MKEKKLSCRKFVCIKFLNGKSIISFIDSENFISHFTLITYTGNYKLSSICKLEFSNVTCYSIFDVYSGKYLSVNGRDWI